MSQVSSFRAKRRATTWRFTSARASALARAELLETVIALVKRIPDMRLDPAAEQPGMIGWLMRGYRPLNIVFDPGPQIAVQNTGGDWSP